uniref:Uncharacterized protein n=1 Tax=Physcomitrium patens TaxID=3218 RepID=A0A2K1L3K8_PHYPA|nr:hypothetical protein PHYPA_003405 [Physcomitrium patens]
MHFLDITPELHSTPFILHKLHPRNSPSPVPYNSSHPHVHPPLTHSQAQLLPNTIARRVSQGFNPGFQTLTKLTLLHTGSSKS